MPHPPQHAFECLQQEYIVYAITLQNTFRITTRFALLPSELQQGLLCEGQWGRKLGRTAQIIRNPHRYTHGEQLRPSKQLPKTVKFVLRGGKKLMRALERRKRSPGPPCRRPRRLAQTLKRVPKIRKCSPRHIQSRGSACNPVF